MSRPNGLNGMPPQKEFKGPLIPRVERAAAIGSGAAPQGTLHGFCAKTKPAQSWIPERLFQPPGHPESLSGPSEGLSAPGLVSPTVRA